MAHLRVVIPGDADTRSALSLAVALLDLAAEGYLEEV